MKKQNKQQIIKTKFSMIATTLILILAIIGATVSAITISQMQTKLQNTQGITNITQITSNKLQYTYTGMISKINSQYNATLGYNVTSTKIYNGTQQYNLTIINPKSMRIIINKENLTLIP